MKYNIYKNILERKSCDCGLSLSFEILFCPVLDLLVTIGDDAVPAQEAEVR